MLLTGCKGFNKNGCELLLWDIRYHSKPIQIYSNEHQYDVTSCKFLSDNKTIISCSKDGSIILWKQSNENNNQLNENISLKLMNFPSIFNITSLDILSDNWIDKNPSIEVATSTFDGRLIIEKILYNKELINYTKELIDMSQPYEHPDTPNNYEKEES